MASKNFLAKGILSIKQAAKMIGINLTKRKSLQSIPVIGSGVGALMNGSFINKKVIKKDGLGTTVLFRWKKVLKT